MIIAFYPGSGGNRYSLYLQNKFFNKPGGHMHQPSEDFKSYQYLSDNTENKNFNMLSPQLVLTHCLNKEKINLFFPEHPITKIKADYKKSLRREWVVVMQYYYQSLPRQDQISYMFAMIAWHDEYYQQYPVDWTVDTVIDIDNDDTLFGEVMRRELNQQDEDFDFVWECFYKFGADAPIIDLWSERVTHG